MDERAAVEMQIELIKDDTFFVTSSREVTSSHEAEMMETEPIQQRRAKQDGSSDSLCLICLGTITYGSKHQCLFVFPKLRASH